MAILELWAIAGIIMLILAAALRVYDYVQATRIWLRRQEERRSRSRREGC